MCPATSALTPNTDPINITPLHCHEPSKSHRTKRYNEIRKQMEKQKTICYPLELGKSKHKSRLN
jgi:hypothetical protein